MVADAEAFRGKGVESAYTSGQVEEAAALLA